MGFWLSFLFLFLSFFFILVDVLSIDSFSLWLLVRKAHQSTDVSVRKDRKVKEETGQGHRKVERERFWPWEVKAKSPDTQRGLQTLGPHC